jgi:uncharacterized protein YbjT (DUF2867 family)
MTRVPQRAPELPEAQIVRGDFAEPATLQDAFAGVSSALLVSAAGQPGERARLHQNAFQAAAHARVGHVVYLSLQGAAPESKYPFSRDHYRSEQYLFETGLPCTVLRNAFYMDMFPEKFDSGGVIRGPAQQGRGAFVSREDVARTTAAVLLQQPRGIYDVTGCAALSIAEVAAQLSLLVGRTLRYEDESTDAARERFGRLEPLTWRVDLSVGWFAAIAAGELLPASDTVARFTGTGPQTLADYFRVFPKLLEVLKNKSPRPGDQDDTGEPASSSGGRTRS